MSENKITSRLRERGFTVTEGEGVNGRTILVEFLIDGDPALEPVHLDGTEAIAFAAGVEYGMLTRDVAFIWPATEPSP